ncbi:MAG TPA: hypothetical protein VK658_26700 [Chryseolinea sp.]|nr:hypothetical protein [Chryseolinea sp.]
MKQIKYILPAAAALLISVSCEDDAKKPFDNFQQGAIPLFVQGDDDTGFIDLTNFDNSRISFALATEGEVDVSSVDVMITYNNSITGESTDAKYATLTAFPAQVDIGFSELVNAFPKEVLTADSLDVGDSFTVNGYVLTGDGRYLDGGYSPSVVANKTVFLNYNVACASDLGGTYDYSTTVIVLGAGGNAAACAGTNTGAGELEDDGGGVYAVSDVTFGVFDCAYGDTPAVGAVLNDVCGDISFGGADQYGDTYTLTVISNDGTSLVIEWSNTYGDKARTTLARNDGKSWPLTLH